MADKINPGITGNAFGVVINMTTHTVTIAGEVLIDVDPRLTSLFHKAYVLGREHKKMEIRQVLNVS